MNKKEIIEFFNSRACNWDSDSGHDAEVIRTITANASISEGLSVLDIGCGTGVMIPFYLERNVASITGVDISENMLSVAKEKFTDPRVSFICADAETMRFEEAFDCCVIYNAFPHFPDPDSLVRNLAEGIKPGGTLTIAHGSSREHIDRHHMEHAGTVSKRLMSDDEMASLLSPLFDITVTVSNEKMVQIVGVKKG